MMQINRRIMLSVNIKLRIINMKILLKPPYEHSIPKILLGFFKGFC